MRRTGPSSAAHSVSISGSVMLRWGCIVCSLLFGILAGHFADVGLEAYKQAHVHTASRSPSSDALRIVMERAQVLSGRLAASQVDSGQQAPWADAKAESDMRIVARSGDNSRRNSSDGPGVARGTLLVLSPMRDRAHALDRFFEMLIGLTYPKHLVSVGVLEGDSKDSTFADAQRKLAELTDIHGFRRAVLVKRDFAFNVDRVHRHEYHVQQERRSTLSRLRNYLFTTALYDEDWVMWVDSDLAWYPRDVIEMLMAPNKTIIVPHCLLNENTYDYNSWQETKESWELQATMQPEELLYEGYMEEAGIDTRRLHMSELQVRMPARFAPYVNRYCLPAVRMAIDACRM